MNPANNDVGSLIDARPLTMRQVSVMLLCGLVILLDGFDLQTMSLAVPSLSEEWQAQPAVFSFALSAALLGMLGGSAVVAPLGDRFGRRPVLLGGMLVVGAASLLTAYSGSPTELSIWRFATGVGLGTTLPNATALTSEYVPVRSRVLLISLTYACVALGALIAGFVAPLLIDAFGWRSIFAFGGLLPLVVTVLIAVWIPESLRLLVAQRPNDPRIEVIAKRFLGDVDAAKLVVGGTDRVARQSVAALLSRTYRSRTLLLWATLALSLFVLYVLVSWLPTVLTAAGWTRAQALRGSVMNQAGGIVGGLIIAWLIDRRLTIPAMVGGYVIVAIALALFLVVPGTVLNWFSLLFLVGAGVSGGQVALNVLAVLFYPPPLRATGSGWANTVGRLGALLAPFAGGLVLQRLSLRPVEQLALLVAPVLLCAFCAVLLGLAVRADARAAADHSSV